MKLEGFLEADQRCVFHELARLRGEGAPGHEHESRCEVGPLRRDLGEHLHAAHFGHQEVTEHHVDWLAWDALPPAICAHQNHWFWGPPDTEPDTLIWLQWRREGLEQICSEVERAGEHFHDWGMAEENRPIFICRDPIVTMAEAWPDLKNWN